MLCTMAHAVVVLGESSGSCGSILPSLSVPVALMLVCDTANCWLLLPPDRPEA